MALTLVIGPANSAKAGEVFGAYTAAAARGGLLVVPTSFDAQYYRREVAASGAVLGTVVTFAGLTSEIARRVGYEARVLSAFQREHVVRRVVARTQFEVLGESAASEGFASAAADLVSELQRASVSPERFATALDAWVAGDQRRRAYASDLRSLYRGYRDELSRIGRVDPDLRTRFALDALRAAPGRWGSDPVFFYGFDDLTALERDAVETLSRVVGTEVTVSLNYEPGRAAFAARAEAAQELLPLAGRVVELPALDAHYEADARDALHHLERSLFETPTERVDPGEAIRLLEAGGQRAEAELVAAEVLSVLRSGTDAEEIVVLGRSRSDTGSVFEHVFREYGIVTATTRELPLPHTMLGRGLLALARCAWLPEPPAAELLAYLRTPGIAQRSELVDRLELDVRCDVLRTAEQALERLDWTVSEIDTLRQATNPSRELAWQARRLFAAPHRGRAPQLDPAEDLDAAALATLLRALEELRELAEDPSGSELLELLEQLTVQRNSEPRPGAVLLAEPLGIRARRFRAVFVCGLQEGRFPLPGSPEPFLSDERRREIAAASGLRLRRSEESAQRERYLFYACVSRATEQLVLSYRSADEEGNIELPSPFLSDVGDLLVREWPARRRQRLLADVVWEADAAPTARERARAQALAQAPRTRQALGRRVLGEQALAHVRHREVVSAGALETYADCPVKWLVDRELAPARLEPESAPLLRGGYIHTVLEELLRRLEGPVTAESLPRARAILDQLLIELPAPIAPGQPEPLRAAAHKAIEADIRRYLSYEAEDGNEWRPEGLELRFGFAEEGDESLPAVSLGDGEESITMRGVIDRLDIDPAGSGRAIVRDYKTGSSRPEHAGARWAMDRQLQVALYMVAARQLLGVNPVAGLYQPLGGGDLRPRGIFLDGAPVPGTVVPNDGRSAEELQQVLADAVERSVALAGRLRRGELTPCPQTCSRNGCSYPGICRSQ